MHLLKAGIDHHRAPLDVRARLAPNAEDALALEQRLHVLGWVDEVLLLTTCNRTELFVASRQVSDPDAALHVLLAQLPGAPPPDADCYLTRVDDGAAAHLMRVAAGLESAILGETEIQGQVRRAMERSRDGGTLGPVLERLTQCALRAGKRARSETALSAGGMSHGSAAADVVRRVFGNLAGREVLLVGAGEAGAGVGRALAALGPRGFRVANRTAERAEALAAALGGRAIPLDGAEGALGDVHVVALAASGFELPAEVVAASLARRRDPLVLVDLAVPRSVDPGVRDLPGVFLYDLEDLERLVAGALAVRHAAVPAAEAIVHEELSAFRAWLRQRHALPAIRSMNEWAESLRQEELAHLPDDLPPTARAAVERLTKRLVRRLLGRAAARVVRGTDAADPTLPTAAELRSVFGLDEGDPP